MDIDISPLAESLIRTGLVIVGARWFSTGWLSASVAGSSPVSLPEERRAKPGLRLFG